MFGFLFGWRKASKCKRVMKQLQCRLKLLKNKKYAITTYLRNDIVQLLRTGERNRALHRAQQLFLDENLMSLYHLLLHFSDFILINLSYIRRHRELSGGINEAISTLVFASARCGDLPELRSLRLLFGERYGQPFVATALHLLPDNRVNLQVKEKLSITSVSDDVKSNLLGEIAQEYGLRLEVLALEYSPEVIERGEEEEEKEVKGSDLTYAHQPCPSQSEAEVYKFTLTDMEEKKEESRIEASRDQRKECEDQDDFIEEDVVAKDQRVFRFRESEEDIRRERKRSRRRTRSRSASSSPIAQDVECWRYYYYKGRRRREKKDCGQCYHIVYNVFSMWPPDQKEKENVLKEAKHVHPKLPDYDQIAAHFTALRRRHML